MQFHSEKNQASTPDITPTDIRYHRRSRVLELVYAKHPTAELSAEFLRVASPSAEVRGHGVGQEVLQYGKQQVAISMIQPMGHYAIKLVFDDGHDSGIYTWDYLFHLATHQETLWQEYLQALDQEGKSRDPNEQAITLDVGSFDPKQSGAE